jgi:hypothetical protein
MPVRTLIFDRLGEMTFNTFPARQQKRVLKALDRLLDRPPEDWPTARLVPLENGEGGYWLRVPPDLYVLIVPQAETIEVKDIAYEERLRFFAQQRNVAEP